jgi:hypothetical protein
LAAPGRVGEAGAGGLRGRGFGRFLGPGGTITAVSSTRLTLQTPGGSTVTVTLTPSTAYYRDADKAAFSDLKVGQRVRVQVTDPLAATLTAGAVQIVLPQLVGTVTAVNGSTITITDPGGFTRTIHTSSSTSYTSDGQRASASAVTKGKLIRAAGTIAQGGTDLNASRVDVVTPGSGKRGFGFRGFGGFRSGPAGGIPAPAPSGPTA